MSDLIHSPALPLLFDPATLDPEAAALLPRLASQDAAVRRIALLALADLEDETALAPIVALLRADAVADVRAEAARVLGAWERDDVVEALCSALVDPAEDVRDAAALSLSQLKDVRYAPIVARWSTHNEPFVRAAVLRALRELRYEGALEPALAALRASEATVRLEAVSMLGWLKNAQALGPLTALAINDTDADVRRAATSALGLADAEDTQAVDALLYALRDDAWQVREAAATTLGKLRPQHACDALLAALDDEYWQIRLQAVRALGKLRDGRAVAPVAVLLAHTISNLRKEAALALGELGDATARPALETAAADADPEVRKAVRIALAQIDGAAR